ncbi:capsular polysaccharide biosynthesis protein [Methanocaldococcus bathoardescens]|uniref:Capsular polysaccharide biosynthesis protein n=1 Tax=Methanocaldococcus bathoardescens TaxID=1301915 RepID=A0A076LBN8_9EURY|nr:MinD/ParA family protein [Methanocaldococcus bathoardescens]AIJ05825.1 capsular polysaccharide biosynthesis protein [Methanocaldococcus bathoardescens]
MKVITFSIAKGGTGKTIVTANVAAALAKKGKKILLIDGDIGSKSLSHLLNVKSNIFLADVVEKERPIKDAIVNTPIENIELLAVGKSLADYLKFDVDILKKFKELGDYDYIFIDAPSTSSGVETYLALGFSDYFVPVLDYTAFGPSLQGAINTIVIGKNYLESIPAGFIINKAEDLPESVINDVKKILGLECISIIHKNSLVEQSYAKKEIVYLKSSDKKFVEEIDKIVDALERLKEIKERDIPKVIEKIKESTLL